MLALRNSEDERKILEELVSSDSELLKQHQLFQEEMLFKQELIDARKSKEMTQKETKAH